MRLCSVIYRTVKAGGFSLPPELSECRLLASSSSLLIALLATGSRARAEMHFNGESVQSLHVELGYIVIASSPRSASRDIAFLRAVPRRVSTRGDAVIHDDDARPLTNAREELLKHC